MGIDIEESFGVCEFTKIDIGKVILGSEILEVAQ
jgi:hypothetical protein